ncbi:actin-like protein arp8 [Coemansia sp. RSA 552]|nr:actin-like protein arp8 [Coemansia sp. RSA 552]
MSGLGGRHKKYSWLPETNPAALSGDVNTTPRSDSGEKQARPGRGRGRRKTKDAGSREDSGKTTTSKESEGREDGGKSTTADGLGISTPGPAVANPEPLAESPALAPVAEAEAASVVTNPTPGTQQRRRRRSRKDSVDDLVRSRFISSMQAPEEASDSMRRTSEQPPMAAITANVRDALAHERSAVRADNGSSPVLRAARPRHTNGDTAAARTAPTRLGPVESKYSFPTYTQLGQRNVISTMRRGDAGVGSYESQRSLDVPTGENVIVIHPGSRWLRIGRASDAVPREVPHVIARRFTARPQPETTAVPTSTSEPASGSAGVVPLKPETANEPSNSELGPGPLSGRSNEMDMDQRESSSSSSSDESVEVAGEQTPMDATLGMLRSALKQHQRLSKRKTPPNARSQVLTYNRQATMESIQDHNDPFRVEWIATSEIPRDHVIGEKALRIADPDKFVVRYPLCRGHFNIDDYASTEEVLGDLETIWTEAIETELGITRGQISGYGAMLVIPDLYSQPEVVLMAEMLLRRMGFSHLLLQQSSALVTFGAGFSSACVVDVGAQKTSVCCVEDGYCAQESRVSVMYGGDDITRFLFAMFERAQFPYQEASLVRMYDWAMLNELRERFCTVNLSDVNIRLHSFFVRQPTQNTRKYSFKTYDEPYQAPLCLFYPSVMDSALPDYSHSFFSAAYPGLRANAAKPSEVPPTPTQFGILPSRAVETTEARNDPPTAPATVPATAPGTPDMRSQSAAPSSVSTKERQPDDLPIAATVALQPVATVTYVSDPEAQDTRMPLDAAITHSIAHAGSIDRARKLYTSIVIVGGGVSFISGFDDLLASRLIHMRPAFLQSVERADIVSAPRDLDPRVLAWKGGAVLSRLECAREMWVSAQDWADFGPRMLRDRVLFPW